VGIASTLIWAFFTDIFGKRWLAGYYIAFTGVVSLIIILVPSTSVAGIFGAYYWAGSIYCCQATFFAWANDELRHESHAYRAVVLGSMNCAGNTFNAFWPLIFYAADQAPYFTRGMYCMIVICILVGIWTTVVLVTLREGGKVVIEGVAGSSEEGSIGMTAESADTKTAIKE
jgi:ACS family pantothenate transporter-like MFS transporter